MCSTSVSPVKIATDHSAEEIGSCRELHRPEGEGVVDGTGLIHAAPTGQAVEVGTKPINGMTEPPRQLGRVSEGPFPEGKRLADVEHLQFVRREEASSDGDFIHLGESRRGCGSCECERQKFLHVLFLQEQ